MWKKVQTYFNLITKDQQFCFVCVGELNKQPTNWNIQVEIESAPESN